MDARPLRLSASATIGGLPEAIAFAAGSPTAIVENLTAPDTGDLTITVTDADGQRPQFQQWICASERAVVQQRGYDQW